MKKLIATAILLVMIPALAWAGNADSSNQVQGYGFVGPIVRGPSSALAQRGGVSAGLGAEALIYRGLGFGAEAGYAEGGRFPMGTGAIDFTYHFIGNKRRIKIEPFLTGGYSLYFGHDTGQGRTENGWNVGGGASFWVTKHVALRCEVRGFAGIRFEFDAAKNFVAFRVGFTFR